MGENIRGKWKIKMNDLKSSQIIESLKERNLAFIIAGVHCRFWSREILSQSGILGRSFCQCCAGRRNPKVRGLARKLLE